MRPHLLLALPLLAGPLAAQQRALTPAPSRLFLQPQAPAADSATPHTKMSTLEGTVAGGIGGLLAGLVLAKVTEASNPCHCEDPGLNRAVSFGLVGLVAGAVIGGTLAHD